MPLYLSAQIEIKGNVSDRKNEAIIGANIYLEGTYDGTTSDEFGNFKFNTNVNGLKNLLVTYLGFENKVIEINCDADHSLQIKLRASAMSLDAVEITTSSFKAGDNSKVAELKPLDIVTTAGSMGDVIAAMQTLPGTQSNTDDGRLFVRGGDARETNIFVDGLKVFTPYTRSISGTPARGRFSPFLFKGVNFSTGAYSSEFGQALSGILNMNTIDDPKQTQTNLSLMSVGLGLAHTQKWNNSSLSTSASYIDLTPYTKIINSRLDLLQAYRGFSSEAVFRHKTKNGLIKSYSAGDVGSFKFDRLNLNNGSNDNFHIKNKNIYSNTSFRNTPSDSKSYFLGLSAGTNQDNVVINDDLIVQDLTGLHGKYALKNIFNDHFILNIGGELIYQKDDIEKTSVELEDSFIYSFDRIISAAFAECDYFFTPKFAFKPGIRLEYNSLFNNYDVLPRITIAQKINAHSQLSAAAGMYSQEPNSNDLFYDHNLMNEHATHYTLNYTYKSKKQIVRLETYLKDYTDLLSYDYKNGFTSNLTNDGFGQAYGLDVFWRSNQLLKNIDFWVSYSWLQNTRKFKDYPIESTPQFSSEHNLSIITKKWFSKLKSQLSLTYQFASGRPYEDPNTEGFMNELSKPYNNISLSWSYLISQQKILFISVSNITNFKNEFGYRFSDTPDDLGQYRSELMRPNDDQFFFIGYFVTFSDDKTENQLDKL